MCLLPSGCACPGVAAERSTSVMPAGAEVFVGIGPSSGAGPTLAARSLARWCQEVAVPPPADAVDPCLVGTWRTSAYVAPEAPGVVQTVTGGEGGDDRVRRRPHRAGRHVGDDAGRHRRHRADRRAHDDDADVPRDRLRHVAGRRRRRRDRRRRPDDVRRARAGRRRPTAPRSAMSTSPATDVRGATYATVLGTALYTCTPVSLSLTHVLPGLGPTAGFELTPDVTPRRSHRRSRCRRGGRRGRRRGGAGSP